MKLFGPLFLGPLGSPLGTPDPPLGIVSGPPPGAQQEA